MGQIIRLSGGARAAGSGLTGDPDIPGGLPDPKGRGRRRPLHLAAGDLVATVRAALSMCWRASSGLTLGLAAATALAGLIPAVTAAVARALVNVVVEGYIRHAKGLPDEVTLAVTLPGVDVRLGGITAVHALILIAGVQTVVLTAAAAATAVSRTAQQLLQEQVSQTVQAEVMELADRQDLRFFEDSGAYDLLQQVQREAMVRPVSMLSGLFSGLQSVVTLTSLGILLFGLQPWLAVATLLAPIPAFVSETRYGMRGFQLALWGAPIRRRMDYLVTLMTTDTAAKEVKANRLGPYLVARFRLMGGVWYRRSRQLARRRFAAGAALGLLTTVAGAVFTVVVAWDAVQGRLSLGDLALYTGAVVAVQAAVQGLFGAVAALHENGLYLTSLRHLQEFRPAVVAPPRPAVLPPSVSGRLAFEGVSFTYPGAKEPALREVSFSVAPGERIAVVGVNGAGKSTMVKLACRLYDPDAGRITLDGIDLRDLDPADVRRQMSVMFQDYVPYQATVAENIGLGDPQERIEDRPAIQRAAESAGVADLVEGLPRGYDTPLGKWFAGGVQLSGGQWQKIALARAFVRAAPVLLLDEPTAALDAEAESDLFERLDELAAGRTAVYISHRFSTVRRADRIIVLEGGRLIESGEHRDLLAADGEYARLYRLQAAAYAADETEHGPLGTLADA